MPNEPKSPFLIGEKDIKNRFGLGDKVYNTLVRLGMPVTKINNRIYGHYDNINVWLQELTAGGEYNGISEDELNEK